ncbi:G5 domain-containing protein [Agromyces ramosus]|uniref:G5 domain-containing protein n=1 Tax=Agromyces ramosus TaxID=33879 RepID=A0ABU0R5Z3_9MICO|nr:G5 domain-containing protein [Agromyces ramosus]MDQ0893489.1 hypothetical protein [Agromyces ramosus]
MGILDENRPKQRMPGAGRVRKQGGPVRVGAALVAMVVSVALLAGCVAADQDDAGGRTKSATSEPTPTSMRTVKQEETREAVPFTSTTIAEPSLDIGTLVVATPGQDGERVITYEVVYEEGREVGRTVVSDVVSVAPVQEIRAEGSRVPPPPPPPVPAGGCDPNYSGPCVPVAFDVDCAGGSGDGPAYVSGPVQIIGDDPYDLDRDGDGIACD